MFDSACKLTAEEVVDLALSTLLEALADKTEAAPKEESKPQPSNKTQFKSGQEVWVLGPDRQPVTRRVMWDTQNTSRSVPLMWETLGRSWMAYYPGDEVFATEAEALASLNKTEKKDESAKPKEFKFKVGQEVFVLYNHRCVECVVVTQGRRYAVRRGDDSLEPLYYYAEDEIYASEAELRGEG